MLLPLLALVLAILAPAVRRAALRWGARRVALDYYVHLQAKDILVLAFLANATVALAALRALGIL